MKNKTDTCNANPIGERQVNYSQNDITASPRITQSETSLAYHNNYILLGFNDSNTAGSFSGYAYSNDNGKTWINGGTVPTNSGWTTGGDPVIAVDSKGIFYYIHLGTRINPSENIIQMNVALIDEVTKSINFKLPIQVSTLAGTVTTGPDKPWAAVGPDANRPGKEAIYIVWTDFQNPMHLRFTKLSTGANPQVLIPPKTLIQENNFGANVVVDKDGVVYVFYENRALTPRKLRLFKSVDGGFNFNNTPIEVSDITKAGTDVVQVTEGSGIVNRDVIIVQQNRKYIRTFEIPQAAIGPDNVIYVVWNDGRNQATTGDDIYLNYSINKGDNWLQAPIRITNNIAHEIQPSVAADCHGAHIQYTRFNSANNVIGIGDSTFALFKKTFSLECGLSAESMVTSSFSRVPDTGLRPSGTGTIYNNFDPGIAPFYMGEYNQVIIGPGNTLLHSWSDNRHDVINGNNPDIFFIQTRAMDPCGESTPCECKKEHDCDEDHKCHEDDDKCCKQDGINTENKNIYSPNNSFSPQIIIKQDPSEHPKVCPTPMHCSGNCYK